MLYCVKKTALMSGALALSLASVGLQAHPVTPKVQASSLSLMASTSTPVKMMSAAATGMLRALKRNQAQLKSQPDLVPSIVRRYFIPYVSIPTISAAVVGPRYWRSATASQRAVFQKAFMNMVVKTYSAALQAYDHDKIRFYRIRGGVGSRTEVTMNTLIIRRSGQTIPVSYHLIKTASGWRIDDFSVENISMVSSYRSQFASVLARSGFSGLLLKMKQQSQKVAR